MPAHRARAGRAYRPKTTRLLDQVREVLRYHHYAYKTEQTYISWILRFIRFNGTRHPAEMGKSEIERQLSHLAINRAVSASTQSQAMNSILFLYRHVLDLPVADQLTPVRSRRHKRLPTVLSQAEVRALLSSLRGPYRLMAETMYAGVLRLGEVLRLRVHDLDFDNHQLFVRDSTGNQDRTTLFPSLLHSIYRAHLARSRRLREDDLADGREDVALPDALARKLPGAARSWGWQYVWSHRQSSRRIREAATSGATACMNRRCSAL